jgi:hypothetical protein
VPIDFQKVPVDLLAKIPPEKVIAVIAENLPGLLK